MEGIIRHARESQPQMDIMLRILLIRMLNQLKEGKIPMSIAAHESVTLQRLIHFFSSEVADRIQSGNNRSEFGGTHPKPAGNAIAAEMIEYLLKIVFGGEVSEDKNNHEVLDKLIDEKSYYRGDFLSPEKFSTNHVWKIPDWKIPEVLGILFLV